MSLTLKEMQGDLHPKWTQEEMESKMNLIHNMDCLEFMKKVPDDYFDLVLTDIPYEECDIDNNGIWDKNSNMADMHKADKNTFDLNVFIEELERICSGSFYVFCGTEQVSRIREFFNIKHTTRLIIWEKTNPMPINGKYVFLSGIETCVWSRKSGTTFNESCRNTVFRYPLGIDRSSHPTTKPLKLFEEFIKISSNSGDKVFDLCMGSGTTAIASLALNRDWCGCELESDYVEIANKRLEQVQGSLF